MAKNGKKSKAAAEEITLDDALTKIKDMSDDGVFWIGFKVNLERDTHEVSIGVKDPEDKRAKAQFVSGKDESLAVALKDAIKAAKKVIDSDGDDDEEDDE